jgi:hypothetical protein
MIALLMKNRLWSGHPRCDFIRIVSENPQAIEGYRIDGARLTREPTPNGYLQTYRGWYHPATSWEIEEYRRYGGRL